MSALKARTHLERMGFVDEDLKRPSHDTIMLWLDSWVSTHLFTQAEPWDQGIVNRWQNEFEEARAGYISNACKQYVGTYHPETGQKLSEYQEDLRQHEGIVARLKTKDLGGPPAAELPRLKKVWEVPLRNSRGFEVGFADLVVRFDRPILELSNPITFCREGNSYPEQLRNWANRLLEAKWEIYREVGGYVFFEVKTIIPSLGELSRQLSLYRACTKERYGDGCCRWYVVSPDDRFAEKIREQGYHFIKYEPVAVREVEGNG